METPMMNQKRPTTGPVIGIVIVLAVIVVGVLYFWGERVNMMESADMINRAPDEQAQQLRMQGSSDDLSSIEADLNATNIQNIDSDINN